MEILFKIAGVILLFAAVDVGRDEESKIKLFSKNWWIVCVLLFVGLKLLNVF